ncbi:MAG: hypothetical protein PVJ34_20645 [Anaerolineae bacterium]|jgi:uncharacterized repeat protein (TIGR01451 family)
MKEKNASGPGRAVTLPALGLLVALTVLGLAALVTAQAPVSVQKSVSPGAVYPGEDIEYTAIFSNGTASDVAIEAITDTLPPGFTLLLIDPASDISTYPSGTTGTVVWTGPFTVPASGTQSLIYHVYVDAASPPGYYDNDLHARLGSGEVISDAAAITIWGIDLDGAKSADLEQVRLGDPLEYEVELTNDGTLTATLSAITDTLPAPFAFDAMLSGLPAPTVQGNQLIWAGPIEIAPNGALTFRYRVIAGGTPGNNYANAVEVAYDDGIAGPYVEDVTLLERRFFFYLPITVRTEETEPPPPPLDYRLAYETKPGDNFEIYTIDADGTNEFNVSDETGGDLTPAWSPDGTKIAWVHYYDGKGDILVANADGTGKINITNNAIDDRGPVWSPDGTRVLFYSRLMDDKWEVYTIDPDGNNLLRLTDHACQSHDAVWSPDGTKIAYVCGIDEYANVYVMDADGQNGTPLTDDAEHPDEALAWSPDGLKIAYVRYDGRNRTDSEIWVVNVASGDHVQITDNDYTDYSPAWSPDGSRIAFSTYIDDSYEIALMDPDGANLVNLTATAKGDYVPKWSPDGTMISFVTNRDGNSELYVMNADGSDQFRLTYTDANELAHNWMPQVE